MFEFTDRLEFRLNRRVLDTLLNPAIIVAALENPLSISKGQEGVYSAVVRRFMGTKTLEVKASVEGDGGRVACYDQGAPRWSYFVKWWNLPGSATVELTLGLQGYDDGLKGKAKRLLNDLKVHVLNGDVEEAYSRVLGYFKGGCPATSQAQPVLGNPAQKSPIQQEPVRHVEKKV